MESLKRFLAAGLLMVGLSAFAANPAYESFKGTNGQVVTTPGIGAARVVIISGQNFQPGSTNLTNWANLSTNVLFSTQIWTNDNGTVYLVPTDVFEVFTTNLNNEGLLSSLGPLAFGSTSQILSLGTNDVDTSIVSDRVMTSPTNNAALVTLRLTPPTFGAQLLFISNGDTNTAWTLVDGQTNTTGGGVANLQGDFVANAPGIGLILKADGNDWVEMGRFNPGGLAPAIGTGTPNTLAKWTATNSLGNSVIVQVTNAPFNQYASDPGVIVAGVLKAHSYLLATTIGQATGDPTGFDAGGYLSSDPSFYRLIVTNTAATNRTITLGKQNYTNLLNDTVQILLEFNGGASLTLSNSGNVLLSTNWIPTTQGDRLSLGWNNYNQKWEEQWRYPSVGAGQTFADLVWTNTGTAIQPTGVGVNTNAITINPVGNIAVGSNAVALTGTDYYAFTGYRNYRTEDPIHENGLKIGNTYFTPPNINHYQAEVDIYTTVQDANYPEAKLSLYSAATNSGASIYWQIRAVPEDAHLSAEINNINRLNLVPTASDGSTPYTLDTSLAHTSGNLTEWKNLGVTHLTLASTNGIATPAITAYGAGSHPWQFGMATNTVNVQLTATNVLEFVVNGVSYLVPASLK